MTTIVVKKSQLATFKGFGLTTLQMAERLNISEREVKEGLDRFNMTAKRQKPAPTYLVEYIDDSENFVSKSQVASALAG